jgi:hypothetical protein
MMRKIMTALTIVGAMTLAAPLAQAQKKGKGGEAKAEAPKTKSYDFTGDEIDGELVKPDGDFLDTRKFANHTSLIRLRTNFIKEILKSAEDL